MNEFDRSCRTISYTFFASQLAAITIYGGASAIVMFLAGDSSKGLIIALQIAAMIAAVVGLRLPTYFASHFSRLTISFLAIAVSIFALILPIDQARSYIGLPEGLIARAGVIHLRNTAYIGVICFALALVANILAAFIATRQTKKDSTISSI